jgi:hypothetical protein
MPLSRLKHNGLVLLAVLVVTCIVALMTMYTLTMGLGAYKLNRQFFNRDKRHYIALSLLEKAERALMESGLSCVTPILSANELLRQPLAWWQEVSCQGDDMGMRYAFVVEDLGLDPCAVLTSSAISAHYYRIAFMILPDKITTSRLIWQSTLIKPETSVPSHCVNQHSVKPGRQSLRILTGS